MGSFDHYLIGGSKDNDLLYSSNEVVPSHLCIWSSVQGKKARCYEAVGPVNEEKLVNLVDSDIGPWSHLRSALG
ncbi:MAG: hypothetical protein WAM44_02860 [Chthoniobacterales bacterium]